jgi:hypothetical protein
MISKAITPDRSKIVIEQDDHVTNVAGSVAVGKSTMRKRGRVKAYRPSSVCRSRAGGLLGQRS